MATTSDKLSIKNEMLQFDIKNRDFYKSLNDEEQKKFSPYLMIRWGATVKGPVELQQYYLISANERLNKHFFDIPKEHKELAWLLSTTVSPGLGKQYHQWIPLKYKKDSGPKVKKFLQALYPSLTSDDLDTLLVVTTEEELKQLAQDTGMSDKEIKELFK